MGSVVVTSWEAKVPNTLGKEPSDGGKHCGAAIGELGPACPVNWDVVTEVEGVELMMK